MGKWMLVAAARPNFMKIAPLMRAIAAYNASIAAGAAPATPPPSDGAGAIPPAAPAQAGAGRPPRPIEPLLVHTGQHYDANMSEAFFRDLNIPAPAIHLGIGAGSHAEQTGRVMIACEQILQRERPDGVIVVGDVNSTMACALAAVKLHIPVAHVEAGLRSFDRTMPEEINRLVTDAIADILFTPSPDGDENLLREGVPKEKIFLVGDIMVDSLLFNLERARQTEILARLGLCAGASANSACAGGGVSASAGPGGAADPAAVRPYALLTLHRPANVDDPAAFARIVAGLRQVAARIPILFPVHPRTRKQIAAFAMEEAFDNWGQTPMNVAATGIHCLEPLGYLDFLNLMAHARLVLTDSGGIQEETTVLNIPCVTIRDTTERPITLTEGTNVLVGDDPEKIVAEANRALDGRSRRGTCPAIWDGRTADRIIQILANGNWGQTPIK